MTLGLEVRNTAVAIGLKASDSDTKAKAERHLVPAAALRKHDRCHVSFGA